MPRFARIDKSGFAIDVYDAPDITTLEKRMGVTGFMLVPDDTKNGAITTVVNGAVTSVANPKPPPEPEPKPIPQVNDLAISTIAAVVVALVNAGLLNPDEQKVVQTALANAAAGTP